MVRVAGTGSPDEADYRLWEAAVEHAVSVLGEVTPFEWTAHLAQAPQPLAQRQMRLRSPTRVSDDLELLPVDGVMMTEALTTVGKTFASQHYSALISVRGVTECYRWSHVGEAATLERLRLLSGLLSLAWDVAWYLRDGPSASPERWYGAAGPVSGSTYRWFTLGADDPMLPSPVDLPKWFGAVYESLLAGQGDRLTRALLMHHEGVLISREHPSLALVAFTAVVETIGASRTKPTRCQTCRQITGSTERFRATLATVIGSDRAKRLGELYSKRSTTAHASHLHGREAMAGGWGRLSLYEPDPASFFEAGELETLRNASRLLLLRAIDVE